MCKVGGRVSMCSWVVLDPLELGLEVACEVSYVGASTKLGSSVRAVRAFNMLSSSINHVSYERFLRYEAEASRANGAVILKIRGLAWDWDRA